VTPSCSFQLVDDGRPCFDPVTCCSRSRGHGRMDSVVLWCSCCMSLVNPCLTKVFGALSAMWILYLEHRHPDRLCRPFPVQLDGNRSYYPANEKISWIMLSPWAIRKLQHLTMDYMQITCPEGQCYGVLAVHRINWALGMLHLILAAFLIGVKSTRNTRASIQNG
jgi:hypothetical protein